VGRGVSGARAPEEDVAGVRIIQWWVEGGSHSLGDLNQVRIEKVVAGRVGLDRAHLVLEVVCS
jgi:hypothetical protein